VFCIQCKNRDTDKTILNLRIFGKKVKRTRLKSYKQMTVSSATVRSGAFERDEQDVPGCTLLDHKTIKARK
jgi:hypothetical protein